eukprot:scaffold167647_cov17-Tisochrysis_lutea.AAC.1
MKDASRSLRINADKKHCEFNSEMSTCSAQEILAGNTVIVQRKIIYKYLGSSKLYEKFELQGHEKVSTPVALTK